MTVPGDVEGLRHDLQRVGLVDVDDSTRRRSEYSSDASLYRIPPAVVAFPRSPADIEAALEVCRDRGVPITARGSGTSIAGNAVGPGLVLDVRRHMAGIYEIDPDRRTAVVGPGVVLDDLQRAAAPFGLRFGPDPSTHSRCTIGGMIGNNACGSRALGYGRTVDHVVELDVLTGAGERVRASAQSMRSASSLADGARRIRADHAGDLSRELGRFPRQVSGYGLHHLLEENGAHLGRALVGSEGTCAITLGATVSLVPEPSHVALVVLGYPDMASAADAVPTLARDGLTAVEGLDARIVDVVRARRGRGAVPDLPAGGGWLFVEVAGEDQAQLRAEVSSTISDSAALGHRIVTDPAEMRELWRIREDGSGLVATSGAAPAHAGWEDAAVPPARLGAYLRDFEGLLAEHALSGVPYGHFGDGCVHVRITFPLQRPGGQRAFRTFLVEAARLVSSYDGSLSGEHGDGRARSELLELMYSREVLAAFADFKRVCDPDGILNPGILVRPDPPERNLRAVKHRQDPPSPGFTHRHDRGSLADAAHRCTGIGRCVDRHTAEGTVMCPSYAATGDERDSTRGRARVLQEAVAGSLLPEGLTSEALLDALDLCLSCKGCASDCPTGVDMATYKSEVLFQAYRRRLRPRTHYTLGWLPRWARLAGMAPTLTTRLMGSRIGASVVKRLAGVDQRRRLPTFAARRYRAIHVSQARPSSAPRGRALLWVDTFVDRFSPQVAVAAVRVLQDAGYGVVLPPDGLCCALTWITTGQLTAARRHLRRTVDALAPYAQAGVPIVGLEPSCTAVFRSDSLDLLGQDDASARAVAAATQTFAETLAAARPAWTPPRLDGVQVIAQPHCHQHAVMGWAADRALLAAAGAEVTTLGGCCGLAGNFGMEQGHHDISVAVAETSLLPSLRAAPPDTIVLADGFSCRTQVAQLADRPTLHLAELLAHRLDVPS